jgi:mRNA-degrading endonuclease RelE of RelBE toxin-antitoxin system
MKTRIELDPQVVQFVRSLAPEARLLVRRAIRTLEREQGDLKPLEEQLAGYWRLRVGNYRVIIRFFSVKGERVARCVYAERRSVIYELFAALQGASQAGGK